MITGLCEKTAGQEFEENDDDYRDTIEIILDTERVIAAFKENRIEMAEVTGHFKTIIDNVENILENNIREQQ